MKICADFQTPAVLRSFYENFSLTFSGRVEDLRRNEVRRTAQIFTIKILPIFDRIGELLQQEGYVLLSGSDRRSMIKWAQNPKYYQNTEENLISRWFVRKDKLEPYDIVYQGSVPKDWWYSNKVWLEDPRNKRIL